LLVFQSNGLGIQQARDLDNLIDLARHACLALALRPLQLGISLPQPVGILAPPEHPDTGRLAPCLEWLDLAAEGGDAVDFFNGRRDRGSFRFENVVSLFAGYIFTNICFPRVIFC